MAVAVASHHRREHGRPFKRFNTDIPLSICGMLARAPTRFRSPALPALKPLYLGNYLINKQVYSAERLLQASKGEEACRAWLPLSFERFKEKRHLYTQVRYRCGNLYQTEKYPDFLLLNHVSKLNNSYRTTLLTPVSEWGKWINGGGWLKVEDILIDFLYRNMD